MTKPRAPAPAPAKKATTKKTARKTHARAFEPAGVFLEVAVTTPLPKPVRQPPAAPPIEEPVTAPQELVTRIPAVTEVPAAALDWPKGLTADEADKLFAELEKGTPKSKAPAKVGLAWRSVFRWMKLHKDFGDRVEEAVLIGYQSMVDEIPGIADEATCKDSAAAANCRIMGRKTYLQLTAPHRYAVKQLQLGVNGAKPGDEDQQGYGILIIPAKITGRGLAPNADVIDGQAVRVIPPPAQGATKPGP